MTTFLRLLGESDKGGALFATCASLRAGETEARVFGVEPESFRAIPTAPFAYWVSEAIRQTFRQLPSFGDDGRQAQRALSTNNDFRYLRLWWEREQEFAVSRPASGWLPFAKGGAFSRYYADIHLILNWIREGVEIEAEACKKFPYLNGNVEWVLHRECNYLSPGLTWPLRTQGGLSFRAMPSGCIFGHKGPAAFVPDNGSDSLLAFLAITNSQAFALLVSLQMAFGAYEAGVILRTPVPNLGPSDVEKLAALANRAWSLKREMDTVEETSHAFLLPNALRILRTGFDLAAFELEIAHIQSEIDSITFDLYGFSEADRATARTGYAVTSSDGIEDGGPDDDAEGENENASAIDSNASLLSWATGVAFGRFDLRLATGEREAPDQPNPFAPLPTNSPGMLPKGARPFHGNPEILVDDPGHPHDLARLIEEILAQVDLEPPFEVRRWLQREFFPMHLKQYSKSRRKAPIYWPLSTTSSSYTLWIYYPNVSRQTLYTAVNDFIEPKLEYVRKQADALRAGGRARSRGDDQRLEALQTFEAELIDLRDTLLQIAPTYRPSQDDGVQITAAPLWRLFRYTPWQKALKETWGKLEKGDYDWSRLAMAYWVDRVREKCKTDKSLAIAHDLEDVYVEPEPKAAKTRGRKKGAGP